MRQVPGPQFRVMSLPVGAPRRLWGLGAAFEGGDPECQRLCTFDDQVAVVGEDEVELLLLGPGRWSFLGSEHRSEVGANDDHIPGAADGVVLVDVDALDSGQRLGRHANCQHRGESEICFA